MHLELEATITDCGFHHALGATKLPLARLHLLAGPVLCLSNSHVAADPFSVMLSGGSMLSLPSRQALLLRLHERRTYPGKVSISSLLLANFQALEDRHPSAVCLHLRMRHVRNTSLAPTAIRWRVHYLRQRPIASLVVRHGSTANLAQRQRRLRLSDLLGLRVVTAIIRGLLAEVLLLLINQSSQQEFVTESVCRIEHEVIGHLLSVTVRMLPEVLSGHGRRVGQIGAIGLLVLVVVSFGHELGAAVQRGRLRQSLHLLLLFDRGGDTATRPLVVIKLLLLPVPRLMLE